MKSIFSHFFFLASMHAVAFSGPASAEAISGDVICKDLNIELVINSTAHSMPVAHCAQEASPSGPTAIVLIVPGSGTPDINGNLGWLVQSSPYRRLAEAMALRNLSVFRYQKKRNAATESDQFDAQDQLSSFDQLVAQVLAMSTEVASLQEAECIWLAGHSQGGLVALAAAQNKRVCGVVLMGTPSAKLGDIFLDNLNNPLISNTIFEEAKDTITAYESGKTIIYSSLDPILQLVFNKQNELYIRSEINIDPLSLVKVVEKPIFIAHGENDFQVSSDQAFKLHLSNNNSI